LNDKHCLLKHVIELESLQGSRASSLIISITKVIIISSWVYLVIYHKVGLPLLPWGLHTDATKTALKSKASYSTSIGI
jgi:hypothetical protein